MSKKFFPYIMSLLGGALYASGFPMAFGQTFILGPFLGFLLFNFSIQKIPQLKMQLVAAFSYSLGFYLFGFYWIPHLLQEFGGLMPPFNFLLGLFFALVIIPQVYFYTLIKNKLNSIVGLAFFYTILEILIPQQFPAHLGHTFISLVPSITLHFAPIFGAPIFTFITALLVLSILKKSPIHIAIAVMLLIFNFLPIYSESKKELLPAFNTRIVQPNIGNFLKLDSERGSTNSLQTVFQSYYDLSTAPSQSPLNLIIWPETSFPTLLSSEMYKTYPEYKIPKLLSDIIEATQAELFIGGYDLKNNLERSHFQSEYNAAFHFNKNYKLKDVYHKMHLIPFGEGLPFGPLNQFLSKYITNVSFFAEGSEQTLFQLENKTPFVSAICYEILFPRLISSALSDQKETPQFLINLTNDSWYGDTAEPDQHLFLAKWRAIEFNLPIIRSTNTGITTVIYADGSESARITINEKKFIDLNLEFSKRVATPYQKYGHLSFLLLTIFLIVGERILLLKGRVSE